MNKDDSNDLQEHGISEDKPSRKTKTKYVQKKDGNVKKYEKFTKAALMEEAKKLGIEGRNMMDKRQLIKALSNNK